MQALSYGHGQIEMIDVPKLLNELDQAGISNAKVAIKLNVYRSTVCRWKKGNDIKWKYMRQLMKLYELHSKQPISL